LISHNQTNQKTAPKGQYRWGRFWRNSIAPLRSITSAEAVRVTTKEKSLCLVDLPHRNSPSAQKHEKMATKKKKPTGETGVEKKKPKRTEGASWVKPPIAKNLGNRGNPCGDTTKGRSRAKRVSHMSENHKKRNLGPINITNSFHAQEKEQYWSSKGKGQSHGSLHKK